MRNGGNVVNLCMCSHDGLIIALSTLHNSFGSIVIALVLSKVCAPNSPDLRVVRPREV